MNIRRNITALTLGAGLVAASGVAAYAYAENPPTGELVGVSETGATLGQTFQWRIQTPESERVVVSVDHTQPDGFICPPVQINGHAGDTHEIATPAGEHSIEFAVQHPGEHIITARDAVTGEYVAAHTVYGDGDAADNCAQDPALFVTGAERTGLPAGTAATLGTLLLGAGGLTAYFFSRRRTALQGAAIGAVPPHYGA